MNQPMISVLFVCHGNICRSPMAEAVFQQMVNDAGLGDQIRADSAGTIGYHAGETAHRGTLEVLRKHNIPYDGRSRKIKASDFEAFDYVVTMDDNNLRNLRSMPTANANTRMFLSYANDAGTSTVREVPDPYYDGRFDYVYHLVKTGCEALLAEIRKNHNL
ncbi:MAG: low molecular weight protein-tyrosine-phosphatase [Chloroflexota bacterium]